jgi:hypothetical protein
MLWQVASRAHPKRFPPTDPTDAVAAFDVPEPRSASSLRVCASARASTFLPLRPPAGAWLRASDATHCGSMRAGHSLVSLPDGRMLFYGGHDGYKPLSDLYFYSPDTGKWAQVLRGPGRAPRAPPAVGGRFEWLHA